MGEGRKSSQRKEGRVQRKKQGTDRSRARPAHAACCTNRGKEKFCGYFYCFFSPLSRGQSGAAAYPCCRPRRRLCCRTCWYGDLAAAASPSASSSSGSDGRAMAGAASGNGPDGTEQPRVPVKCGGGAGAGSGCAAPRGERSRRPGRPCGRGRGGGGRGRGEGAAPGTASNPRAACPALRRTPSKALFQPPAGASLRPQSFSSPPEPFIPPPDHFPPVRSLMRSGCPV